MKLLVMPVVQLTYQLVNVLNFVLSIKDILMRTVYLYDKEGLFTHTYNAQQNPEEPGTFIAPDLSTDIEPPFIPKTYPKFVNGVWITIPDHRGAVWDVVTGISVAHIELGELPVGVTNIAKPEGFYHFINGAWVFDLNAARFAKRAELKQAVSLLIVAGIVSDALGSVYNYPTGISDQINISGLITESLLPGSGDEYKFWCGDISGVWARRIHTKLQIQQVGKLVANHVKLQQDKYEQKLGEVEAANEESLALVVW